jgi:hypothetical protein
MSDQNCLIIDDASAALELATSFGRSVLEEPAERIRGAVLSLAARRGWLVAGHREFASWARDLAARSCRRWIALDPLLTGPGAPPEATHLRLSRIFGAGGERIEGGSLSLRMDVAGAAVGILDDAIASGRTMRLVARSVREAGGTVAQIAAAAASPGGLRAIRAEFAGLRADLYLSGEWRTAHMRDGCPHLPYSGRSSGLFARNDAGEIELRILAQHVVGSPWQVFVLDSAVRAAVLCAQATVAERLSHELGRTATIGDLPLLGAGIPGVVMPSQTATAASPLDSLFPAQARRETRVPAGT